MTRKIPIMVDSQILADVGRGIYRSPASALKELVSNSFDAGARNVWLSSNVPYFDTFVCEDDGDGMGPDEFEAVLGRIGASAKRAPGAQGPLGRALIGRLGIGLLAVSQICTKFTVISKKRGANTRFTTTIDLSQFDPNDQPAKTTTKPTKSRKLGDAEMDDELPVPDDEVSRQYTKVVMFDMRPGFTEELKDSQKESHVRNLKSTGDTVMTFSDFVQSVAKGKKPVSQLSAYDTLLWELALACPIEYIDRGPFQFRSRMASADAKRLRENQFKVFVDGLELRKPLWFPTAEGLETPNDDYKVYRIPTLKLDGESGPLRLHGYVYSQRSNVRPPELQGILIRIRDVGIGPHDKTLLRFPGSAGPMLSLISGELFVEQGLQDALNIDRNSFNEIHPHYRAVQAHVWDFFRDTVFTDMRARSKDRRERERAEAEVAALSRFAQHVRDVAGEEIKVKRKSGRNDEAFEFDQAKKLLTFHSNAWWASDKKTRQLQERMVLAFFAAKVASKNPSQLQSTFFALLSKAKLK